MRTYKRGEQWVTLVSVADQEQYEKGPIDFGASYEDGTLERVIQSFLEARAQIPRKFWSNARCQIGSTSGYEGSHYAHVEITYARPATPAEIAATEAAEKARVESLRREELTVLANLKAKYEKTGA